MPILAAVLLTLAPQGTDPGPVVLLAERADASLVDELAGFETALLLRLEQAEGECSAAAAALGLPVDTRCVALRPNDPEPADSTDVTAALCDARLVGVDPGGLEPWFHALWPRRHETESVRALWDAHRGGATLVGRGLTAGLLSAATVIDRVEQLSEVERNPRRVGAPSTAWGAGFQPWAVLDTEGAAAGRIDRLARVLVEDRLRLGVFLESRSALVFDAAGQRFVARGQDGVLVLDLRTSRRREDALYGARLSRLRAGDAWVRRGRRVLPPRGLDQAEVEARTEIVAVEDAFDARALRLAFATFERAPVPSRLVLEDGQRRLVLEVDGAAAVHPRESGGATLASLVLDLEWGER